MNNFSGIQKIASPTTDSKTPQTVQSTNKKPRARETPETLPFDQREKAPTKIKKHIKSSG